MVDEINVLQSKLIVLIGSPQSCNSALLEALPFAPREIDKFNVIASVKFGTLKDLTPISGISG